MAKSIEEGIIRFPEDMPTDIPMLRNALVEFARLEQDPYVFQALLYFFSSLIEDSNLDINNVGAITALWNSCRAELRKSDEFIFHNATTCSQTDSVIDRLNPIATICELRSLAAIHVKGNPSSRLGSIEDDFTIISRGYDWIVRCVYKLNIPETWKAWLELTYEKQPARLFDTPENTGYDIFFHTIEDAANIEGFDAMIPLIKFWLRQALTIVEVWNQRLMVDGDEPVEDGLGASPMPPYPWCDAAYRKMWCRFINDIRDPFSDYPYMVRQEVLRRVSYQQVFEQCWEWVCGATAGVEAKDFDPFEVRAEIHNRVLTMIVDEYQPQYPDIQAMLEKEFGRRVEGERGQLLAEGPIVSTCSLEEDLQATRSSLKLCENSYNPATTHRWMGEMELTEDVQFETYGPLIDLTQFTFVKQPAAGDFCSWCQNEISLSNSHAMRCLVPVSCKDTFHACCLADWVNSVSKISNFCPNCMIQMTYQKRTQRKVG